MRDADQAATWGKLIDRDGTLWMASSSGIHRLPDLARLLDSRSASVASRDPFLHVDGLTAPYASAFFEDREGNIWIGTAGGIDRFRESRLTPVDLPRGCLVSPSADSYT